MVFLVPCLYSFSTDFIVGELLAFSEEWISFTSQKRWTSIKPKFHKLALFYFFYKTESNRNDNILFFTAACASFHLYVFESFTKEDRPHNVHFTINTHSTPMHIPTGPDPRGAKGAYAPPCFSQGNVFLPWFFNFGTQNWKKISYYATRCQENASLTIQFSNFSGGGPPDPSSKLRAFGARTDQGLRPPFLCTLDPALYLRQLK